MTRPGLQPIEVLLCAIEEAQNELLAYLDPMNQARSAETTIDKLTHILQSQDVLDAMMQAGWTPPWLRPGARKPRVPSA